MRHLLPIILLLLGALAGACGGSAATGGGLQFDPAETTPTRIVSGDGRIEVLIQPTAFTELVRLSLAERSQQDAAVPGGSGRTLRFALELRGTRVVTPPEDGEPEPGDGAGEGAAEAEEPAPLQPATPLEVTVTGLAGFRPGASVPLYAFNNASQRYEQSGVSAVLQEDGTTAKFSLAAFGRYALYGLLASELPPPAPGAPRLTAASTQVRRLAWDAAAGTDVLGVNLYRALGDAEFSKLSAEPLVATGYVDYLAQPGACRYRLTAVNSTGLESAAGPELFSPAVDFDLLELFGSDRLENPVSLCWDGFRDRLLVADAAAQRVFAYGPDGAFQAEFAAYKSGTAMLEPLAVASAADGSYIYIADGTRRRVYVLDGNLAYVGEFGGPGDGPGEFARPAALAVQAERVIVADAQNANLQSFTPLGVYLRTFAVAGTDEGQLGAPSTLLTLAAGDLLVADAAAGTVLSFDSELAFGELIGVPAEDGGPLDTPSGLAEDFRQRLYISDTGNRRVVVLDGGELLFHFGSEGSLAVELGVDYGPAGLAYDPQTGYLYVADPGNRRIAVFAS